MAPTGEAYNVDWIISNNSNVNVANHLEWFTTLTIFNTYVYNGFQKESSMEKYGVKVLGIGDVTLPVKTGNGSGASSQGSLALHDVCYVPGSLCNIVGFPDLEDFIVNFSGSILDPKTKAKVAIFDTKPLMKLRLKGQSPNQSSLDKGGVYFIRANLPEKESARWQAYKKQLAPKCSCDDKYTPEEKKWLKDNWQDEFHFLQAYQLSIHKEEDRAEGRRIVRALMQGDTDEEGQLYTLFSFIIGGDIAHTSGTDETDGGTDSDSDPDDFLRELELDPTSHAADYHFSEQELKWIKMHYQNATNFLYSYGLKFYDDDDCQEGKVILKELMAN